MVFQVEVRWGVRELGPIVREAVTAVEKNIRERSKRDIAGALNHPQRFVRGLTTRTQKIPDGYAIQVFLRPGYARVWEYGGTSVGKPLLWLPAPGNLLRKSRYVGKLFRPRGSRVLISTGGGRAIRGMIGTGPKRVVKYIGVRSVTHSQRFHLRQIALEEANKLSQAMLQQLR